MSVDGQRAYLRMPGVPELEATPLRTAGVMNILWIAAPASILAATL